MSSERLVDISAGGATWPMTAAQRGIYYAQQLEPDVPMSVSAYAEFHDAIDVGTLAQAIRTTSIETESAHMRVVRVDDDEPIAVVDTDHDVELGEHDFSDAPDPRAAALAWIDEHRSRTVDLFTDPLLETYLLHLSPSTSIWYCWGHHIAFDGYGAMYMMVRVAQHYTALAAGTEVPDVASATMAQIAEIDDDYRGSAAFGEDRDFWRDHLLGADGTGPDATSLSPRTASASPVARVRGAELDDRLVDCIRTVATRHRVRPASVITAAVAAYLARFNDRDDAMLSLPVAVRDQQILRTSAGLTSNVVPILAQPGSATDPVTVEDFLTMINAELKHAVRHQRFRHEEITGEILGTTGSRGFFGPMVNVMLFFEQIDFGAIHGDLHVLSTGPVEDLSINVYDSFGGGMRLDVEANPAIYGPDDVETHRARITEFLRFFVSAKPDVAVTDIPLSGPAELVRVALAATGESIAGHDDDTLIDLLANTHDAYPQTTALIGPDGTTFTYDEFHRATSAAAAALRGLGVGADSIVAVMIPRSAEQVVALHAVIMAGGAFLPIDPGEPTERREHMLATAQPELIVTTSAATVEGVSVPTHAIEDLISVTPHHVSPSMTVRGDNAAYVLFTSGSTGRPKGVVITHRAIVNRLRWMQSRYPLDFRDRVLQKTPSSFDVSVWEFFWPMTSGAALVVPTPDCHRDPWQLRDVIAEESITTVHFVPSMLAAFAAAMESDSHDAADATRRDLTSLRQIFTSGEALTPATVAAMSAHTSAPIHNLYGPTEAAIDVTYHDDCQPDSPVIPIGRPVWNTTAQVLDHNLRVQPVGAIGELYLGGVQVARGYRARPDLTASRFIADPAGSGARLYRTGDLVRRAADGSLEYLGRTDSQIKVRGQRVELGEIEAVLADLPGVGSAAVVVRGTGERAALAGYVVGDGLTSTQTRSALADRLPAHMIPATIDVLDVFPTTANGKLDRRALPEPVVAEHDHHVAPVDAIDRLVVHTVGDVLGIDLISMGSRFFELGGNSLSATRVAARLSTATRHRIGIRSIFDADTIADIAQALRNIGISDHDCTSGLSRGRPAGPPGTGSASGAPELSPAQQRLWLTYRLDPDTAATYNMPFTVRLVGRLDIDALGAALGDVIARHEPLRTTIIERDGRAYANVVEPRDDLLDLPLFDASDSEDPAVFAGRPFDLTTDLPIRARLVRDADDDHRLSVAIHHIAADGWSLAPLAADLATAYRARRDSSDQHWLPLPKSYAEAGAELREILADRESGDLEFWRTELSDPPAETELPIDRPRPRSADVRGATHRMQIGRRRHTQIRRLADDYGVTVFMVLHAAVAALLRSMSRTDDIVIGTPVSGRGDADLDPIVGMFVNTVALRTVVDKSSSFADLLAQVRERDISAFDHATIPFDQLVQELNPPRSTGLHPLFQVSLAVEDASAIELDFTDLTATATRIDTGHTKFDVQFTFSESTGSDGNPSGLGLEIGYATALFDEPTIVALGSRLRRIIDAAAAGPDTLVGDIGVLGAHERLDLVPAVGAGARPVEHLTSLLAAAADADPEHIALSQTGQTMTYQELDAASNRLARLLIELGAGPEQFVAVSLPRGLSAIVTLWAVAKTGAAWIPVDPDYPADRRAFMLSDSGAELLVADSMTPPIGPGDHDGASLAEIATVIIDDAAVTTHIRDLSDAPVTDSDRNLPIDVDQPAYLIYTSGTTGRPKGVVVSHRGLADFAAAQVAHFNLTAESRTLHLASPSFDASVLEILMAVSAGARMHIVRPGVLGGRELVDELTDARVTHAFLTPSLLTTMSPDDLPDLHTVVIGGENPNPEVVRRWSEGRSLFNAYGPTETTVVATMSNDIEPGDTVTIGRPIHGVSAMVLDERLRPVAPGAVGELYISGPHLARGYHGIRPLTSKRFVANPFGDVGERMYRTGDLVRWTAEHALEFRGRADDQTKIRGHRIELGEIDAALVADDRVQDAVTTTHGDGDAIRLTSYITVADTPDDITELIRSVRAGLARRLPRHMIPSAIITLDRIPTTPIGKVDMRALPSPDEETTTAEPAQTPAEQAVVAIIADVLQRDVDDVGRHSDFFDLGGTSLSATQVAAQIEDRTGQRIPARILFDKPTAALLAEHLGEFPPDDASSTPTLPILRHDPDTEIAPGPAQQQLWFLNQMSRADHAAGDTRAAAGAYNISFALTLTGDLDVGALNGAYRYVIDRHEPLRTIYPDLDGTPGMRILDADQVATTLTSDEVSDGEWHSSATALAAADFDLTADAPIRAVLHRIADRNDGQIEHRLTIAIHHVAADGFSMSPLARDLAEAYRALAAGSTPGPAALPVTYRDYLRWQSETLAGSDAVDWWATELAGLDHSPILAHDGVHDTRTGENPVCSSATLHRSIDANVFATLTKTMREQVGDASEFMTVHAVFAAVLHRFHADPEVHVGGAPSAIVIGTPTAGRSDRRLADLVGMFVNSVVLRTEVDGQTSFADLFGTVRDRDLDAFSHAQVPFEQVVAAVNPPRTGRHPIFSIALTVDDFSGDAITSSLDMGGLTVGTLEVGGAASRFDLELRVRGSEITFTYDAHLFSDSQIGSIADAFLAMARQVADDPTIPIDEVSLGAATDDARSDKGTVVSPTVTPQHLADIFDTTVRTHPENVAIVADPTSHTYRDLDRRARRWTAHLAGRGIRDEHTVAVALPRCPESVTAVWAIAAAGAAVVPVDPAYPTERIEHMIADSRATVGITDTAHAGELPGGITWLTVDDLDIDIHVDDDHPVSCSPRRIDTPAYVIYTSGSTGTPKGVAVTHRGLAAFASSQQRAFRVDSGSRTLHFASPSFDASMLELLLATTAGATMVIAPPSIYGGDELVVLLADERVTHAFVTPSALAAASYRELADLRAIGVGGEASPPELVARWAPGRRYLNCYGPTESTIVATIGELTAGSPVTIGAPIADCGALILDHQLRPVPDHVPGELYVVGPGVARGYAGRPALTAGRFLAAPAHLPHLSGQRMYRTGDIVHRRDDGSLIYHSRSDNQVKVRGFRIELDEVTRAISEHPGVDIAITVVHGTGSAATLAAYVVPAHTTDPETLPVTLSEHARSALPRQMVPSSVTVIDRIPLTPNGKLDRARLPEPTVAGHATGRAPGSAAEVFVAQIISDVLGIDDVGADDDFFALGGTSLQATAVTSRINRGHRGQPVRVRTVFDHPTVAALAGFLGDLGDRETSTATTASAGAEVRDDGPIPLAPVQRRIWSLARTASRSTDYLIPFTVRWRGDLDVDALRAALCDLISWHSSLRTVYPVRDGEPVAIALDDLGPIVGDLAVIHDDPASVQREMISRRWDVTADVPFAAAVTRTDDDDHTLIVVIHHIAADGASLPVLIEDLITAYRQRSEGRCAGWLRDGADYADYAVEAARAESDATYWIDHLRDAPAESTVPPSITSPAHTGGSIGASLQAPVDEELRTAIGGFAREHGGTVFTVFHTALVILLNRLGVGTDIVVGTPVANRTPAASGQDYERVVGMFVNTLALRSVVHPAMSVAELLAATRAADLDALDHADVPFDDVVTALNPQREPGRHPLFQIALSVHEFAAGFTERLPVNDALTIELAEIELPAAKFDLQFTVTGMGEPTAGSGATIGLTYDATRYDTDVADDLVTRLLRVVRAMVCDPRRPIGDIRISDPLEIAALSPVAGPPASQRATFGDLLTGAARRNPDGLAAVTDSGAITYRELDERSNRLARLLLGRGVGSQPTESVVAMVIPRSIDALLAIWAIVKTGVAYVPVDPTYPADRIAHMLSDSHAEVVVTTSDAFWSLDSDAVGANTPVVMLDDPNIQRRMDHSSSTPIGDHERDTPTPDQLAYMIYTSGSTGRPKGVLVSHAGLAAVRDELGTLMRPEPDSRVLHFASPSFDASVLEFMLAAAGAATLVIAPPDVYGGTQLADVIKRHGVTHAFITPAAVSSMNPDHVPSLSALAVGGEAFGPELVRRWAPGRSLFNVYGPTEATVFTTCTECRASDPELTIGSPNIGVAAVVLDTRLHPTPADVTGELYLIGDQVARGYHDRRSLTATRFVPAPLALGEEYRGQRMYRTGDLAAWTTDHRLRYVGRADDQVQIRGFRVELGEIDDALSSHPDVDFAVTVVDQVPDSSNSVLRSYLIAAPGAAPDTVRLRAHIADRLPRHMIPSSITVLDEIPMTPTGKLDRAALPTPTSLRFRAPCAGLESTVAQVFADVLSIEKVGADDGFFDLGGNSLMATTVSTRLSEALGRDVSAQHLFTAPTPAELAAALADSSDGTASRDPDNAALGPVLTLRRGRAGHGAAPLFVVHPAIGLCWSYTSLLPHLPDRHAVYGLQNPVLSGETAVVAQSMSEVAADYIARMREIAPHGPYRLVGWSLGGLIAQEMAVALTEVGEEVTQLVLLDSFVVAERPGFDEPPSIAELMSEFGIEVDTDGEPTLDEAWQAIRRAGGPLAQVSRDDLERVGQAFDQATPLAASWHPRRYPGDMTVVSATVDPPPGPTAAADWRSRVDGVLTEVSANCSHARILLPENVIGYIDHITRHH